MIKVILWGTCAEYDKFYKWFELEILKGNMEIEAIILNEENLISRIDDIEVIKIDEILVRPYDYLIDMNEHEHETIVKIIDLLNIPRTKVIPVKIFGLPFFDLQRWLKVKESRVSIIANNCWGGYAYNSLGLEFLSPFINMFISPQDYLRILENFRYYMDLPLYFIEENYEPRLKRNYPVVGLGDVKLYFIHYTDFDSAAAIWNMRKKKLNYENLFVEMAISNKEDIDRFLALPFEHKVGFTIVPCKEKNMIFFPVVENHYLQNKYSGNFLDYVNHTVLETECKPYDILKLLNHEKDYLRAVMT